MKVFYTSGKLTKNKIVQDTHVASGNNCVAFIFDKIHVEIDCNRNVDSTQTSMLKNFVTVSSDRCVILRNVSWDAQTTAAGDFNFCVPHYVLLEFCEDYKRVVVNACHELVLIRTRNDNNCLTGDPALEPTLELFKVANVARVIEINKLSMLHALESSRYLSLAFALGIYMSFRSYTTKHS